MVLKAESAKTAAPMRPMSCDPDFDPNCEDPLNDPPASDPGGPYTGQVGQSVQFDGSGSWDPDGSIVSYLWNFGDGGTSTSVTPQHAYAAAGTYNVSLRVRDNDLVYNTAYTTATISAAPTPTPTPTPTPNPNVSWEQTFLYDRYGNRTFDAANTTTIAGCRGGLRSGSSCRPPFRSSANCSLRKRKMSAPSHLHIPRLTVRSRHRQKSCSRLPKFSLLFYRHRRKSKSHLASGWRCSLRRTGSGALPRRSRTSDLRRPA